MDTKSLVEKVVASGILIKEMTKLPDGGATDFELKSTEKRIGVKLDQHLEALLSIFNGANLDVIRFYPCSRLAKSEYGLAFADDPAGFAYHVTATGEVISEDHDGGAIKTIAASITEFVHSYLFGERSVEFAGEEWHQQLIEAGIAT